MMLAATLMITATALGQAYETKYNKFYDITVYRTDLGWVKREESTHHILLCYDQLGKGRVPGRDSDAVEMLVLRSGKDWLYLKEGDVVVMQGQDRFRISGTGYGNGSRNSRTGYGDEINFNSKYGGGTEFIRVFTTIAEVKEHLKTWTPWKVKIGSEDPLTIGPKALAKVGVFIRAIQKPE
jgi:hypothetical protein